jgi:hypothetical protein
MILSRRSVLGLGVAGACAGLGAGGGNGTTESEAGTTALWSWPGGLSEKVLADAVTRFADRTELKVSVLSGDYKQQLLAVLDREQDLPDIVGIKGEDIASLRDAGVIATLLPGVEFSTRQPYPDARRLLDAGVRVALATDCNPGSCFTSSMPLCIALAVREMGMTPGEAVYAATATAAAALDRDDVGVLAPGRRADFVLLDAPSHLHLAYRPGVPLVTGTWVGGRPV